MERFLVLTRRHVLLLVFSLLLLGLFIGIGIFERDYANKFFPNVILGGEDVGGKTFDEILNRIKLVGDGLKTTGLQLLVPTDHATKTITIPLASTGLTPDVVVEYISLGDYEAAAREAFAYGHEGGFWRSLREQVLLLVSQHEVPLPVVVRENAVASLLDREFRDILKKPFDAAFVRGAGGIVVSDESDGERVDVKAVVAGISRTLLGMSTNRLRLAVLPQPSRVTRQKLSALLDFAREVSENLTLELTYQGKSVYASGLTLATWLSVKDEPGISLAVRRDKVADFIRKTIDGRIDDAPQNSRFAMRAGKLIETVPGTPGSAVSVENVSAMIEKELSDRYLASLFPPEMAQGKGPETVVVPITFEREQPQITAATVSRYGIKDLVGFATTSFKGSTASRIHNIKKGVERAGGILLAPGEEFSLVKAIGEVSEEGGFEKEYVIKGDRSIKEAGGGLCQIATTVFRAVLDAGLPVTQRQNHSYVVGYYGPGLDATIYGPYPDLRFINDTGEYLLFQMHVDGTSLTAEFYGKKDGRVVFTTKPELKDYIDPPPDKFLPDPEAPWGQMTCTDHARKGLTADATSTITYADGRVSIEQFHSVYQPWPKICLVGIKLPTPPAAAFR